MQHGDFLQTEHIQSECDFQARLGIVRSDRAVEIGVLPALGKRRVGGRRAHGDNTGFLVDAHCRLGGAAADMAQNHIGFVRDELSGRIGGDFRFADIVFHQQFHLAAANAVEGIDFFDDQLGGAHGGDAVGSQIATVGAGYAQPNGFKHFFGRCSLLLGFGGLLLLTAGIGHHADQRNAHHQDD